MRALITPLIVVLLFALVRSADLAIKAGVARDFIRAIAYGIVALLGLVALILVLLS